VTPEPQPDVKSIFGCALEIVDPGRRTAYLDEACAHAPGVRAEVDELLAMHDRAGGFLHRPAAVAADVTMAYQPLAEGPGTRVGPYKLLQEIGEGGMGTVFMAEQEEPVRRKVALKIVKPGMDTRQVVARFEAERQALSMMDHPNIARVFDAGSTATGRPYFVMELVHGVPMTEFCDARRLSPRERLELFVPVCQAIQHAHQKGVIHRDIKPSNVLVTMYDDKPVPKVIDFGVAKAIEQRLTEKTVFTQYGALVGTFEYMSPEQAEMNALGVDTRSDVYSLGVLLYELLTGTTPLERQRLRESALNEVIRLIKEEEPPRPSLRLSTSGTLANVAAARKTEPGKLSALVRGELDWIAMRCLEKDRARRYESASALARDVGRYLADEPVEACPPSVGYRLRKAYRRNRAAVIITAAVVAGALVAVAGQTWNLYLARAAKADAVAARNDEAERRVEAETARANEQVQRQRADGERDAVRAHLYTSRAAQIQTAWEADDVDRVRDLLRLQVPGPGERDLRGFEWYYRARHDRALLSAIRLPDAHRPTLSPDGSRVVSTVRLDNGPKDGALMHVWDAATGRELVAFKPETPLGRMGDMENESAFSPDGSRILLPGYLDIPRDMRNVVGVWEAATGKPFFAIPAVGGQFVPGPRFACMSADGKYYASEADDEGRMPYVVKVWDTATGKELFARRPGGSTREFGGPGLFPDPGPDPGRFPDGFPTGLAFSPDGTRLAGGVLLGGPSHVTIWSVPDGREVLKVGPVGSEITHLAFSPDGTRLAVARGSARVPRGVEVFDARTGRNLFRRPLSTDSNRVVFSPDGTRLATAGLGPAATILDAATGQVLRTVKGHTDRSGQGIPTSLAFTADGAHLRTIGTDRMVRTWDARGSDDPILFAVGVWCDQVALADAGGRCAAITYDPRGPRARVLKVWDLPGKELLSVPADPPTKGISDSNAPLAISRDGRRVATAPRLIGGPANVPKSELRVWEVDTGKDLFRQKDDVGFAAVTLTRDGRLVAAVDYKPEGAARVWDIETGKLLHTFPGCGGWVRGAAFSPDGRRLACGGADKGKAAVLRVWDLDTGRERVVASVPTEEQSGWPMCVAFSPDGGRLAWSCGMGSGPVDIRIHDAATGATVAVLTGSPNRVQSVAFSPDGRRLLSAGWTRSLTPSVSSVMYVWDTATGAAVLTLPGGGTGAVFDPSGERILAPTRSAGSIAVRAWDGRP
jgi:eukaryotic-like serine/threonine-protein kinase